MQYQKTWNNLRGHLGSAKFMGQEVLFTCGFSPGSSERRRVLGLEGQQSLEESRSGAHGLKGQAFSLITEVYQKASYKLILQPVSILTLDCPVNSECYWSALICSSGLWFDI